MWPALLTVFPLLAAVFLENITISTIKCEDLSIEGFLYSHGYSLEIHNLVTEDGYILTMHRIPYGRSDPDYNHSITRPPVFLMHGILLSSMDWIISGPGKAIALILADAGYDVWLGNNRGNTYSKRHIFLDPIRNAEKFFDFSYHEIGIYDLPAMIDYILSKTNYKKISYFGYSQGFTSFTVLTSTKPEYNEKFLIVNGFAPVTKMYNITSIPFNFLAQFPFLFKVAEFFGLYSLFDHDQVSSLFMIICYYTNELLCRQIFILCGFSIQQLPDKESLVNISANFPAGVSLKQLAHYVQAIQTGMFRPYDYGLQKNIQMYGYIEPPSYNLTKITAPANLYYGEGDVLVNTYILTNSIAKQLANVKKKFLVPYKHFNHLDFIYGKDTSLLTSEALEDTKSYNNLISAN